MEKQDARTLTPQVQAELRQIIVRLRQKGVSRRETAEIVGMSETHVSTIWTSYKRGGEEAIAPKQRGRRQGECTVLSPEQAQEICRIMTEHTPDELELKHALWTRQAVQDLVKLHYGITMPLRTLTDYLRRWGFTCQKPAKQAYEQQRAAVKKWLDEEYPAIAAKAKTEKAQIHWGDETGIENTQYQGRGFSPKGKTPVVRLNAKKSRISMIAAISNQGTMRFMFYNESMNADRLIIFLKRLVHDAKRKVYLILDNLKVHHSKVVTEWLDKNRAAIEMFYLPSYSPELNPEEYLNGDLKRHVHSGTPARDERTLESKARGYLMKIRRRRNHIKGFFQNQHVVYASER